MKITIITVAYKQEYYVGNAIESVLQQDYRDIEYIVIEGKSIEDDFNDKTWEVIQSYVRGERGTFNHKITKAISEKDKGLYDALNKGINMATGDYIGLVHSDDMFYDVHVISKVVAEIERTQCDAIYGNGVYVSPGDLDCVVRNWIGGKCTKRNLRLGWLPLHPTVYIKRSIYIENRIRKNESYDISYKIAGDTELLVRYFYNIDLKISYFNEYIIRMRLGGMSTSPWKSIKKWKEDWRLYRCYKFPFYTLPCKIMRKIPQYIMQKDFYTYLISKITRK